MKKFVGWQNAAAYADTQKPPEDAFGAIYAREAKENARQTIRAYKTAVEKGSCQAAKRLGEIYAYGMLGIDEDYAEALRWYHAADLRGCYIPKPPVSRPTIQRKTHSGARTD